MLLKFSGNQCCQVYGFGHKHMAFWFMVRSYGPMLGHTQNILLFSTTLRLHCQKYRFLLFSFENWFSKTFLVGSMNFFLLFAILGRGCHGLLTLKILGNSMLSIYYLSYLIPRIIHLESLHVKLCLFKKTGNWQVSRNRRSHISRRNVWPTW